MPDTDTENALSPIESIPSVIPDKKRARRIVKRAGGGALAIIGFLLSPISWWNDLLINIPLAYLFAGTVTWMQPVWFNVAFVVGYLLTNILGLVLLQYGMKHAIRSSKPINFKKELKSSLVWSVLYTILIVILLLSGWIQPPLEYLH
ncbi:MAG TPA: hypothetical protein VK497_01970 [Candidatus Saccharimonadales bacterium]|nr:hypothetical protein [Candidatus Saccharimonadales bacterium]